jgi:rhodanese-related sulfurtransferase
MEQYQEFVANNPVLFVALAVLLATITFLELKRLTRKYQALGPTDVVRLMNHEDTLVVDVRDDAEVRQGRIKGARHIPLKELKGRMNELDKHRGKTVVVYCRSGNRSAQACELLTRQGFEKVVNLHGGVNAWQSANLPISKK